MTQAYRLDGTLSRAAINKGLKSGPYHQRSGRFQPTGHHGARRSVMSNSLSGCWGLDQIPSSCRAVSGTFWPRSSCPFSSCPQTGRPLVALAGALQPARERGSLYPRTVSVRLVRLVRLERMPRGEKGCGSRWRTASRNPRRRARVGFRALLPHRRFETVGHSSFRHIRMALDLTLLPIRLTHKGCRHRFRREID